MWPLGRPLTENAGWVWVGDSWTHVHCCPVVDIDNYQKDSEILHMARMVDMSHVTGVAVVS